MKDLTAEQKLDEVITVFGMLSLGVTLGPVHQLRLNEHRRCLEEVKVEVLALRRRIAKQAA